MGSRTTTSTDVNNNTVGIGKLLPGFKGLTENCAGYTELLNRVESN